MALLLASKSAARRRMLEAAGVAFEVVDTKADEDAAKAEFREAGLDARALADALAELKAKGADAAAHDLVLGSDQTLELPGGAMLDKPASREEARAQLLSLSGKSHKLHSAAVIVEQGQPVWRSAETVELVMRPFGESFLAAYLDSEYDAIRWGVGGYRIEGLGAQLFESIQGSHFAIMGMPLLPLLSYLRERRLLPS